MESSSLMKDGLTLMFFGMGFVFLFLTLLVGATTLMSRIITKYEKNVGVLPKDGVPSPTAVIPRHGPIATPYIEDKTLISVISAAVHTFRSRHK